MYVHFFLSLFCGGAGHSIERGVSFSQRDAFGMSPDSIETKNPFQPIEGIPRLPLEWDPRNDKRVTQEEILRSTAFRSWRSHPFGRMIGKGVKQRILHFVPILGTAFRMTCGVVGARILHFASLRSE